MSLFVEFVVYFGQAFEFIIGVSFGYVGLIQWCDADLHEDDFPTLQDGCCLRIKTAGLSQRLVLLPCSN